MTSAVNSGAGTPTTSGTLGFVQLHLPVPVAPAAAVSALQALAGLSGQPRLVLEAVGAAGWVSWRLGAERNQLTRIVAAMQPHLSGLRVEPLPMDVVPALPDVAAQLALPGHRRVPLRSEAVEPVTRGVLAALAAARTGGESVRLQLVLGVRRRPLLLPDHSGSQEALSARGRRVLQTKLSEYRFGCAVRVATTAADGLRAARLVSGVVGALRVLEAPGVRVNLRRTRPRLVAAWASPFIWPLELGVSELVGLLGWPVSADRAAELPGVPSRHPRLLPVSPAIRREGRVLGRSALASDRPVAIGVADSLRHLHLLGPNGVGKSTLMARLALDDMAAGHGVVVIDPKGDLVADLLARIPEDRIDDVVVLDPTDSAPVGIDCFAGNPDLVADVLLGVFHSLYESAWGPRTSDILHACLLSLARRAALDEGETASRPTLTMISLLLTNPGFRRSVTGRVVKADSLGLGSFWATFEAWSDAERSQAIQPLMNKLRQVLLRPGLRAVFGQHRPKFALADVFTKRRILLVNLSEGVLGPEAAQMLGSLLVGLLWQAALGRSLVPERARTPAFVHIDEMQRYVRLGDIGDALARARGLGVGFTLAHQHLGQLSLSLREAVLANARSKVAFQLPLADSKIYAALTGGARAGRLEPPDFQALPAFHAYAQLLTANQPTPWCSLITEPLPPVASPTHAAHVRATSRARYGQPLDDIEAELAQLAAGGAATSARAGAATAAERLGRRRPGRTGAVQ